MTPLAFAAAVPPLWMVAPFIVLLLCIALMPLFFAPVWERHYAKVAIGLGLLAAIALYLVQQDWHPLAHAAREYVSFMALIGALFVISGGVNIRVKGEATPFVNVIFLLSGAVLANLIGTTGASMLLIRPWIRMNKYRITGFHIVFFIFLISNVGGSLTPIGDPPLFLGYLRGVPFTWTLQHCFSGWASATLLLLLVFFVLDGRNFRRAPEEIREAETAHETWHFRGLMNLVWLGIVLGAVLLPAGIPFPVPALVMAAAAAASYFTTQREVHEANDFTFGPVKEVGYLFIGIFLTMIPALQILQTGGVAALNEPLHFYFASGALSAFLDNAPTYLAFLAATMGRLHLSVDSPADVHRFAQTQGAYLQAISLGAVFFGAGSYIGNGPNFMVKAIAERAKVHTPSFVAYLLFYSLPILVPILALVGWLVLRAGAA